MEERSLKTDFHVAKLSLFNARLMHDLALSTDHAVQHIIRTEWNRNHLSGEPILTNQSTFLQMGYICLVWLWEAVRKEKCERVVCDGVFEKRAIHLPSHKLGIKAKKMDALECLKRLRNAFSHGNVEVHDNYYILHDQNPREKDDWVDFKITGEELGTLCESVIFAISDHLYPSAK